MTRPLTLLLADDSPGDTLLIEMALDSSGLNYDLQIAVDGAEALHLLGEQAQAGTLPDYLLLDLNMPRLNGFDVLESLRNTPALSTLPVLVLTTSDARHDQERARTLGAQAFVTKPLTFDDLTGIFQHLHAHWQGEADLPGQWD